MCVCLCTCVCVCVCVCACTSGVSPCLMVTLTSPPVPPDSCPGRLVDISGRAGLFLEGTVFPELQGVEISITERGAGQPLITVATSETGTYR